MPVKPFEGVPYTVQRLMALRPGQSLRYYRGTADDLDRDLTRLHNAVLHQVFACAARLEKQGKVRLQEVPVELKLEMPRAYGGAAMVKIHVTDYLAIGLG
jgi:hypothetical protein